MFVFVRIRSGSTPITQVSDTEQGNIPFSRQTLRSVVRLHVALPIFSIRPIIDLMKKQIKHTMVVCKLVRGSIRFWYKASKEWAVWLSSAVAHRGSWQLLLGMGFLELHGLAGETITWKDQSLFKKFTSFAETERRLEIYYIWEDMVIEVQKQHKIVFVRWWRILPAHMYGT